MKKCLLLLLSVLLLTGCTITRIDTMNYEEVIDKILSLDIKLYNEVGKGYKYYAPKGVVKTDSNTYNDVLKRDNITYYLYADVVSYYYKSELKYKPLKNTYYSSPLKHKNKTGFVEITNKNNKLYVQMVYNYAKIETYVDKKDINVAMEDISYILSSVKFNDSLLQKMHDSGSFGSKEETYKLFDNKEKEGSFIEYIKEFDKYDGEESNVAPEEEIKIKETTTKTTMEKETTTKEEIEKETTQVKTENDSEKSE